MWVNVNYITLSVDQILTHTHTHKCEQHIAALQILLRICNTLTVSAKSYNKMTTEDSSHYLLGVHIP